MKVAIVSEVQLFRLGLKMALERDGRLQVVREAKQVEELLADPSSFAPATILLDVATSNALANTKQIVNALPGTQVIAVGMAEAEPQIIACAEAGISGFVPRDGSIDDLVEAARSAAQNELRCSRQIASALLRQVARLAGNGRRPEDLWLTPREDQVMQRLDEGLTNKEIARDLCIEVATVKNHVHNILEKLEVHSRGAAVAKVRRLGLNRRLG